MVRVGVRGRACLHVRGTRATEGSLLVRVVARMLALLGHPVALVLALALLGVRRVPPWLGVGVW